MRGLVTLVTLVMLVAAAALAGCPKPKPFDMNAAELAIDRVSLAACSQIAGEVGGALVIVTFDPATGRARKVDVDEAPAEPNETLHSARRTVVILRMADWHRP